MSIDYLLKHLPKYKRGEYENLYYYLEDIYVNYDKDEADQKEYITKFFQEELPRLEDDIKRMHYCQKKS